MTNWVKPVTLQGKHIRLEPMTELHIPGLAEIGIGQSFWNYMLYGDIKTECKYLLLTHAFEALRCIRVQLKTDLLNERSQKAIERIGAIKEGVLRNHMILPDGRYRDSVFYSILDWEWGAVKKNLEEMMRNR